LQIDFTIVFDRLQEMVSDSSFNTRLLSKLLATHSRSTGEVARRL